MDKTARAAYYSNNLETAFFSQDVLFLHCSPVVYCGYLYEENKKVTIIQLPKMLIKIHTHLNVALDVVYMAEYLIAVRTCRM